MFAMTDLDRSGIGVLWFHCGAERFHELLERDGILASPYLAKAHWVTVERWSVMRPREIEDELKQAHALIFEKLPPKTKSILALPEKDRAKAIRERKKILAAGAKAPAKAKAPSKPPKPSSAKTPTKAAKARPTSRPAPPAFALGKLVNPDGTHAPATA
jgi:predicted DNA-binding protein (MmcQ/YjbR family)